MSSESPPLAPAQEGLRTVYLDFGPLGRVFRETDKATADVRGVVRDLIRGEFHNPVRVVAFNLEEGWVRDVSAEIAVAIADIAHEQQRSLGQSVRDFLDRHLRRAARRKTGGAYEPR